MKAIPYVAKVDKYGGDFVDDKLMVNLGLTLIMHTGNMQLLGL